MKNILIVAMGLTGHVYPNLHLASALRAAGFDVRILASERFRAHVARAGCRFVHLPSDYFDRVDLLDKHTTIDKRAFYMGIGRQQQILYDMVDAGLLEGTDFVLLSMAGHSLFADCLVRRVPFGLVEFIPMPIAPVNFPLPQLGFRYGQFPIWLSHALFHVYRRAYILAAGAVSLDRFRRIGFLPPKRTGIPRWVDVALNATCIHSEPDILQGHPYILAFSPALLTYPYMQRGPYWLQANSFTGPAAPLPAELRDWLQNGDSKPIFFGYGSLQGTGVVDDARTWLAMIDRLGQEHRAIFSFSVKPPARLAQEVPGLREAIDGGRVRVVGEVDHASLFEHCSVVVHHGGAGTGHTALMCGVPMVVVPHFSDQTFNGSLFKHLGVAPDLVPLGGNRKSFADRLYGALEEVLSGYAAFRSAAQALKVRMLAAPGTREVVALIADFMAAGPASRTVPSRTVQ